MSIASEITRLLGAKTAIKTAIENKGITVPSSESIDNYASYIDNISTGPIEVPYVEPKDVNYIDFDGTLVYSYTAADFALLQEHPAAPDHSHDEIPLTAQGWNWTLADAKAYVSTYGALCIGQTYITTSGKTYFKLDTRLVPGLYTLEFKIQLRQFKDQGLLIEWGDGTSERFSGTGNNTKIAHTYATEGKYTIVLTPDDDCNFNPCGGSGYNSLFGYNYAYPKRLLYCGAITEVYHGKNIQLIGLSYCRNLTKVSLPLNVGSFSSYVVFNSNMNLKGLVFPTGYNVALSGGSFYELEFLSLPKSFAKSFGAANFIKLRQLTLPYGTTLINSANTFSFLYSLVIPETCTTLANNSLLNCRIKELILPEGVTTLGNNVFAQGLLEKLDLPSTITSIGTNLINQNNEPYILSIIIRAASPPTILTTTFANTNNCPVYIPYGRLATYLANANWNALGSRLVELPQST